MYTRRIFSQILDSKVKKLFKHFLTAGIKEKDELRLLSLPTHTRMHIHPHLSTHTYTQGVNRTVQPSHSTV